MGRKNRRLCWLRDLLCGSLIGAGAILPGVSGGVLAVIFGLYQPLMELLTEPHRALRRHGRRFIPVIFGAGIGFVVFAKGLVAVFHLSSTVAIWAFIGLILGTMPALFAEAGTQGRGIMGWGSLLLCGTVMLASLYYISHVAVIQVTPNFWWYSFCGVLIGMGIIIPGMTSSGIMMALGLYEPMLQALAGFDWKVLLAYGPSLVLSIVLLARFVQWMFRRHYAAAYHGIIGIVIASTVVIVPLEYSGIFEIFCSAVCCAAGFSLAFWMARLDRRIQKGE